MAKLRVTGRIRTIEAGDLAARLGAGWSPRVVDVRTAVERRRDPFPGSIPVPLSVALHEAPAWVEPTVVICRSGHRSGLVAARSRSQKTFVLHGGVLAWNRATEDAPAPVGPAGIEGVLALIDLAGLRLWRHRAAGELRGLALEVGAGTGRNERHVPRGVRLVAVEPDLNALRYRRAKGRGRGWAVVARAEALPFRDRTFDSALMTLVMCSVEHPRTVAEELGRVLKPRATLSAIDHVLSANPAVRRVQRALGPSWHRRTKGCRIDRETLIEFHAAGLHVHVEEERAIGTLVRYVAARLS